ncbi:MAG: S9 family peptidase [Aminivibrio sp.]|nr:S9 family peptidase [Aminivibrio sp.]
MKRPVELTDLLRYRFLSAPEFSPEGNAICFFVHQADYDNNGYLSNLWLYDLVSDSLRQLTTSGREKNFAWMPDGRSVLFTSGRNDAKKTETALYVIDVSGGEARHLRTVPRVLSSLSPLPDGSMLALGVDEPAFDNPYDADMMLFDQVPFCSNGKGFTGRKRKRLYLYAPDGTEKQLTPDLLDAENYTLSEDGKTALAWGPLFKDVRGQYSALLEIEISDGTVREVLPGTGFSCKWAGWLNGGVLVTGSDYAAFGINENVKFHLVGDGKTLCITPGLDRGLRNSVGSDCRYGSTDLNLAFSAEGGRAWFVSTDNFRSHLHTVDSTGKIEQFTSELFSVDDWRINGGRAAVVGMKGLQLQELYLADGRGERQLTHFNDWVAEECLLSVPEHVTVDNGTGEPLDGWYMKPVNFGEGKRYPAILNIHGGPKFAYGDVFFHEMQYWTSKGYAVFFCNPRGSDGKGNGFDDIRGKYGTVDYDDLMTFTDWIAKNVPFVDKDRLAVTGGSYGGYMTNWIIGHTDRFKAAASQRSISNWISKMGISDIGYYFVPDQQGADIWSDPDKLWLHSPLKYADRAKTPTLFIHSEEDHRCELTQGLQMFTALKLHGVETEICVFRGENHELSRSGRPRPRLTRLRKMTEWFDRFLTAGEK